MVAVADEIWMQPVSEMNTAGVAATTTFFRSLLENREASGIFNVGCGKGTSLNDLIESIRRVTGRKVTVNRLPGRPLDVPANVLDTSRLTQQTGWHAETDLETGLARTWAWMDGAAPTGGGAR